MMSMKATSRMRGPYFDPSGAKLKPSFVCYADILGFAQSSTAAIAAGKGQEYLTRLRSALTEAYADVRKAQRSFNGARRFEMKVFTDNVVVGYPISDERNLGEPEFGDIIGVFSALQCSLVMHGYLIRGGIAFGDHYTDRDLVFGGALLDAVQQDKSGGGPRLGLAPSAVSVVQGHIGFYSSLQSSPHFSDLLEDADGTIFLDYLSVAFEFFPDGPILFDLIQTHKHLIEVNLERYRGDSKIRSKYEWAARYHNFVCTEFANSNSSSYPDIDEEWAAASYEAQRVRNYLIEAVEENDYPRRISLHPVRRS